MSKYYINQYNKTVNIDFSATKYSVKHRTDDDGKYLELIPDTIDFLHEVTELYPLDEYVIQIRQDFCALRGSIFTDNVTPFGKAPSSARTLIITPSMFTLSKNAVCSWAASIDNAASDASISNGSGCGDSILSSIMYGSVCGGSIKKLR